MTNENRDGVKVAEGISEAIVESCWNGIYEIGGVGDVRIVELGHGFAELAFETDVRMVNPMANLHGGFIMSIADIAACLAPLTLGRLSVTAQCYFSFFKSIPVDGRTVSIRSQLVHSGRTSQTVEVSFYDADEALCTKATFQLVAKLTADEAHIVPDRASAQDIARRKYGVE